MYVLKSPAQAVITVKNSRFLSELNSVQSQAEARERLHELKQKHADASHVVHAFVTGPGGEICGMSDDGEPGGTAGRPVLDVLRGSGLTNCILTVTRWFGGTLLGTGGLVKAYGDAAKAVIAECGMEPLVSRKHFSLTADYSDYESIKRLLQQFNISDVKEEFGARARIEGLVQEDERDALSKKIQDITKGKILLAD